VTRLRVEPGGCRDEVVDFRDGKGAERQAPSSFTALITVVPTQLRDPAVPAYLVAEGKIWAFQDSDRPAFVERLKIPDQVVSEPPDALTFCSDAKGLWLGSPSGLWRRPWSEGRWNLLDEFNELPSRSITGVAPLGPDKAMIATATGSGLVARDQPGGPWRIEIPGPEGHSDGLILAATTFPLGEEKVLALGGTRGLDLMRLGGTGGIDTGRDRIAHFASRDGLPADQVSQLAWDEGKQELWVVTPAGLCACRFSRQPGGGARLSRRPRIIARTEGLPMGWIYSAASHQASDQAWVLTSNVSSTSPSLLPLFPEVFLSRLDRRLGRVVASVKPAIPGTPMPYFGPASSRGPRFAVSDYRGHWVLYDSRDLARSRPALAEWFFALQASSRVETIAPPDLEPLEWRVRYAIDHTPGATDTRTWFWAPDLWDLSHDAAGHALVVELTAVNRPELGRRISMLPIEPSPLWQRLLRIFLLFAVPMALLALGAVVYYRQVERKRWLELRKIPYVAGSAISDPTKFIGREVLLGNLRDTLAGSSLALTGEFRIGKTSILRQLERRLELVKGQYTFIPVYVDLHELGEGRDEAFYLLLGRRLLEKARAIDVPAPVIDGLTIRGIKPDSELEYTFFSFREDVHRLLKYWEGKFAPKEARLVFLIDEIPLLKNLKYGTLTQLRSLIIGDQRVKVVLSGLEVDRSRDVPGQSPWWNFLNKEIEVEPLTPSEARALITKPVRGLFKYTKGALEVIQARGENKPFALQKICADVLGYRYSKRRLGRRITEADVRASLRRSRDAGATVDDRSFAGQTQGGEHR
jgi:hypothetical protein